MDLYTDPVIVKTCVLSTRHLTLEDRRYLVAHGAGSPTCYGWLVHCDQDRPDDEISGNLMSLFLWARARHGCDYIRFDTAAETCGELYAFPEDEEPTWATGNLYELVDHALRLYRSQFEADARGEGSCDISGSDFLDAFAGWRKEAVAGLAALKLQKPQAGAAEKAAYERVRYAYLLETVIWGNVPAGRRMSAAGIEGLMRAATPEQVARARDRFLNEANRVG